MAFQGEPPRLTHDFTAHSRLIQNLIAQGAKRIEEEFKDIAPEVVAEVNGIIEEEFNNNRDAQLRKEGAPHLLGSIKARVVSTPGKFPIRVEVWSTNDRNKVGALEFNNPPHWIPAGNGDEDFLYFNSGRIGRGASVGVGPKFSGILGPGKIRGGAGSRGGTSKRLVKSKGVQFRGTPGRHFMRRGLDRVVQRRLSRGR